MASNERGMALTSTILLLTVLLSLACILTEKIWKSTRHAAIAANREKVSWAAQAGIEMARKNLASSYADSLAWSNYLTAATAGGYSSSAAWETVINGIQVEIFLRDNPDGDGDSSIDNDLKIFALARALDQTGAEVVIESLCGFDLLSKSHSSQPGQASGLSHANLSEQPVSTYGITD